MANPNLVAVTSIYGNSICGALTTTVTTDLLTCASNKLLKVNSIIIEAQKKKIRNIDDLNQAVKQVLSSNQKTILLVIYNSQNQRRYIGVKLD